MIPALQEASFSAAEAKNLLEALFATGRSDAVLVNLLARAIGPSAAAPVYSPGYVKKIVAGADQHGAAERGEVIFKTMACASCHRISGSGSGIGPDLTALGTTLAPGRIVEELLWPNRQIKEGFALVQVVTDEGKIYQGYERRTRESQQTGTLVIQELSSGKLVTIARDQVEEKTAAGSAMPAGLTAILSPEQLQDLVRYLVDLGKIK